MWAVVAGQLPVLLRRNRIEQGEHDSPTSSEDHGGLIAVKTAWIAAKPSHTP